MLLQNSSGDDNYSDDNYDDNDFNEDDDKEADMKLEKLRKAMARENTTAAKVVTKHGIQVKKMDDSSAKKVLRMGPGTGKGTITMDQINREVRSMDPNQIITRQ